MDSYDQLQTAYARYDGPLPREPKVFSNRFQMRNAFHRASPYLGDAFSWMKAFPKQINWRVS